VEITQKVIKVVSDAMALEPDNISKDSRLVADLGAESIDFLDITFRLEREFGVKLKAEEIFPVNIFDNDSYVTDGIVTEAGIAKLKKAIPFANFTTWEKNPLHTLVVDIFTVGSIINYMEMRKNDLQL